MRSILPGRTAVYCCEGARKKTNDILDVTRPRTRLTDRLETGYVMVSLSAIELYKYPHPQPKRGLQELQYAARSVSGVQKDYILNTQPNPKQSTDLKS